MTLARRKFLHLAAAVVAAMPVASGAAHAQAYPSRPITIVVANPAGGAMDFLVRILGESMRASLGQPIIVENIPGANGSLGTGRVARAAPDGYTMIAGIWDTHVANGALYRLSYDVLTDFAPISTLVSTPYLIIANKAVPAGDLKGLIAWLKDNPGNFTAGAVGSARHIGGVLFQEMTGTRFEFVPYRGGIAALQDVVAGHINWMMSVPTDSMPHVREGSIRAFAVTAKTRLAIAPDIPTVDEPGLPGFYLSNWSGVWAPKGTPQPVIAKLNAAIVDALGDESVRQRLAEIGQEIFPREQQTPEALRAYQKAEIEKWWPIIKAAGIKAELTKNSDARASKL